MYKASIELGKINKSMKLKFNLIIKDDEKIKQQNYGKLIDKFNYMGSEYLRISPKPYITIDISSSSDKNDSWNSNTQVNLNKFCLFDLIRKTKRMIEKFKIKDLYYIKNSRLQVNMEIAKQCVEFVRTPNKTIQMAHVVVQDSDNREVEYEGICFMINSVDNFCCLTYDELEYLYYELTHIDMHTLSMELINTYLFTSQMWKLNIPQQYKSRELKIDKVIEEKKEKEVDTEPLPKIKENFEIPEEL